MVGQYDGTLYCSLYRPTGSFNPFEGIDVGSYSAPSFVDLDGDGDLDLVVGAYDGTLRSFANDGAGGFTALTGAANPFNGLDAGYHSTPTFVDLDWDGDLDLVVGTERHPYGLRKHIATWRRLHRRDHP